jgi:ferredoxin
MAVKKVWVEDGCTLCGLCETQCPDVFELGDEKAEVRQGADLDGNEECIMESAEACPVDVIKVEQG